MKRIVKIFLLFLSVCILTAINIYAEKNCLEWYCIRSSDHTQPPLPTEFEFINEYDGYYLNDNSDGEKVIYLTFDAGYENGNIERILDILKEKDVKAAFFILSNLVDKNMDLITRMADEGHLVCNHTSKHKDMSTVESYEEFTTELYALENYYRQKTGRELDKFFRPPEGHFNQKTLEFAKKNGYKTIFWSFAYADWDNYNQMSAEAAKKKIFENVHPGEIMLLHPTSQTNADILGDVIDTLRADGYRFGALTELQR